MLSASSIGGFLLPATNPRYQYSIASEQTWHGLMWWPIGKKRNLPLEVRNIFLLNRLTNSSFPYVVLPLRRPVRTKNPKGFWREIINRKKFFSDFAAAMQFDPLVAENWAKVTNTQFREKGVRFYLGIICVADRTNYVSLY